MRALVDAPSHDDRVALGNAGWRPGQDVAGTVIIPASDGSGRLDGKVLLAISEA
jgi:hypothetical protein